MAVPPAWAIIVASGSKLHVATLPHNLDPGTAQHTQVRKLWPFESISGELRICRFDPT